MILLLLFECSYNKCTLALGDISPSKNTCTPGFFLMPALLFILLLFITIITQNSSSSFLFRTTNRAKVIPIQNHTYEYDKEVSPIFSEEKTRSSMIFDYVTERISRSGSSSQKEDRDDSYDLEAHLKIFEFIQNGDIKGCKKLSSYSTAFFRKLPEEDSLAEISILKNQMEIFGIFLKSFLKDQSDFNDRDLNISSDSVLVSRLVNLLEFALQRGKFVALQEVFRREGLVIPLAGREFLSIAIKHNANNHTLSTLLVQESLLEEINDFTAYSKHLPPLFAAIKYNHTLAFHLLISFGADVIKKSSEVCTGLDAINYALSKKRYRIFNGSLQLFSNVFRYIDLEGNTLLHTLVKYDLDPDFFKSFVYSFNTKLNAKNDMNRIPLTVALLVENPTENQIQNTLFLFDCAPITLAAHLNRETPLSLMINNRWKRIFPVIFDKFKENRPHLLCILKNALKIIERDDCWGMLEVILSLTTLPDSWIKNTNFSRLTLDTIIVQNIPVVFDLALKSDTFIKPEKLIYCIIANDNIALFEVLLKNGLDVTHVDPYGYSTLNYITNFHCPKILKIILDSHDQIKDLNLVSDP